MTLQRCPACKKQEFSWFIDEETTSLTQWHCGHCDYLATEDESLVSDCEQCGVIHMVSILKDLSRTYRYCFVCFVIDGVDDM